MTISTTTGGTGRPIRTHRSNVPAFTTVLRLRADDRTTVPSVPVGAHVRIPLSTAEHPLWSARHAVVEHCADRLPEAVVDDLQIIVSELVANVLEHGDGADGLAIDLTFHGDEVDLQVMGHGDRRMLPAFEEWTLPAATKRSGRGLALVRRLSDDVAVAGSSPTVDEPGWVTITASVRATA